MNRRIPNIEYRMMKFGFHHSSFIIRHSPSSFLSLRSLRLCVSMFLIAILLAPWSKLVAAEEQAELLIDRQPFDRITLDAANNGAVIDALLLDLSNRKGPNRIVPNPFPNHGDLVLRRLSEPSAEYAVPWSSIQKIKLFEQLVLAEAVRLTAENQFIAAYDYFEFLHKNYAQLPGLDRATDRYLQRDALASFDAGRYDEALAILQTLYDRNPSYSGLGKSVESAGDRLIRQHLEGKGYAAARHVLELLRRAFARLDLKSVAIWEQRFNDAAAKQIDVARTALRQKNYPAVRTALRQATAIMPTVRGARELLEQMGREHPEIVVGVVRHAPARSPENSRGPSPISDWAAIRVNRLVDPPFVGLVDFGTEGGVYESPWANLEIDETGRELSMRLTPDALRLGLSPSEIARHLLTMANRSSRNRQEDFASRLENISTSDGRNLRIRWLRTHVRPESLLGLSAQSLQSVSTSLTSYRLAKEQAESTRRYELGGPRVADYQGPRSIVERAFADDRLAVKALINAQVDLLDRVPPWQIEMLQSRDGIVTGNYRLPTVHVLLLSDANPLLRRREFRRSLCYGIDRARIVNEILNAGQQLPGFRPLSGPFPAGLSINDSGVGYAYNQSLQPRTYEPRLAAVLASVARSSVEKQTANDVQKPAVAETEKAEIKALILMFPAEPIARTVCQTIKLQLDLISIPIELREMPADGQPAAEDYDLLYTELAMWEPIAGARRLLGPGGVAGRCSPSMSHALDELGLAQNWKQAQAGLRQVHQVAYYDLPVISLWQTYNYFAYRKTLRGFGEAPISFYQNVAQWRTSID